MEDKGIRDFQKERYEIITTCINQACINLIEKRIHISQGTVEKEVLSIFKKENINPKYIVSAQTIGRNKNYSSIWKKYKKKHTEKFLTKREKATKELEFSIRDKYDMLKQDYIELLDNYNYLIKENKKHLQKMQSSDTNISENDFSAFKSDKEDLALKILKTIKKLMSNKNSLVIQEKEESLIIKTINLKDNNKIIIDKEEWCNI